MFYKKLIILSIFYLSLISYINLIELSNLEDINSNTVQVNQNNNKKKGSINLRNDKKLIDIIKNKIDTTQDNKQLLGLCYNNSIVKSENNTITNLNFNDVKINIEENNLLSLIYNKKLKKLVYTPRLISLLKNNKYFYQVHKKKFIIPFYIFDLVPLTKIPKDERCYYIMTSHAELNEIVKKKYNYQEHHLDLISYLATHEGELNNFGDVEYGDVYTKIDDLFSNLEYKSSNNEFLYEYEFSSVQFNDNNNFPMIYNAAQIGYYLYKIYNIKTNKAYNKDYLNTPEFTNMLKQAEYTLLFVPDPNGLTFEHASCDIDTESNELYPKKRGFPSVICLFHEKYMQDIDLKTVFSEEDINNIFLKIDNNKKENDNYLK